jgi:hypothetical protein
MLEPCQYTATTNTPSDRILHPLPRVYIQLEKLRPRPDSLTPRIPSFAFHTPLRAPHAHPTRSTALTTYASSTDTPPRRFASKLHMTMRDRPDV